ncbi:MAG: GIY-YIG nuclease family protein [Dehalococcoidia bacterium]
MTNDLICARIGCDKPASYEKPLCYEHWMEFDRYGIFECERCHRFDEQVVNEDLCWDCSGGKEVPIHAHGPVDYQRHYLYILKLDGGEFYIGQTNDLEIRLKEHQDGRTRSTKGKHPKLVWFEKSQGNREELKEEEDDLTRLAKHSPRAIRRMVAEWQRPLRLVDLEA